MVNGMESFFKQIKFKTWINTTCYTDPQCKIKSIQDRIEEFLPSNWLF